MYARAEPMAGFVRTSDTSCTNTYGSLTSVNATSMTLPKGARQRWTGIQVIHEGKNSSSVVRAAAVQQRIHGRS